MINDVLNSADTKMEKSVESTREEFSAIRAGRVNPTMFSKIVADYYGAPTPLQATLAAFIADGHFAAHVRRMRKLYAERHDALLDAAARRLDGLCEVRPARSGLATVGRLLADAGEEAIAAAAAARGVSVAPLSRFCLAPVPGRALALGFAAVPPRDIAAGIDALAAALHETRAR